MPGKNIKAILKDYRKTSEVLPACTEEAAVWIRYDGENPSYCRACLTGPANTPYFGGVFFFDVYFPADYPQVPPLLQFLSTVGGTERVHYHLYADGKVCLSLLGNTEGSDGDRWNPASSCLGQVLVSVQNLFFGEHHYSGGPPQPGSFNIPGRSITGDGYYEIRVATLRHAIISVMKAVASSSASSSASALSRAASEQSLYEDFASLLGIDFGTLQRRILLSLKAEINMLTYSPSILIRLTTEVKNFIQELKVLESSK